MATATPNHELILTCFFAVLLFSCDGSTSDTISTGQSLSPNQTIVSNQGKFELGFFSPGVSTNHYVGIWYKDIPFQSVWVANRDNPISPSLYNTSRLELDNANLNLIVNSEVIWTVSASSNPTEAVLLDAGNFVLRNPSGVVWQSFDQPSGTWLPGGAIGFLKSEAKLISWKNGDDPGTGTYSLEMDRNGGGGGGELFLKKNGSQIIWRSGVWKSGGFPSLPDSSDLYNFSYVSRKDAEFFTYDVGNESINVRIVLHSSGLLYHYVWSDARREWFTLAVQPSDPNFCTTNEVCGANAICDVNYAPACRCFEGF